MREGRSGLRDLPGIGLFDYQSLSLWLRQRDSSARWLGPAEGEAVPGRVDPGRRQHMPFAVGIQRVAPDEWAVSLVPAAGIEPATP